MRVPAGDKKENRCTAFNASYTVGRWLVGKWCQGRRRRAPTAKRRRMTHSSSSLCADTMRPPFHSRVFFLTFESVTAQGHVMVSRSHMCAGRGQAAGTAACRSDLPSLLRLLVGIWTRFAHCKCCSQGCVWTSPRRVSVSRLWRILTGVARFSVSPRLFKSSQTKFTNASNSLSRFAKLLRVARAGGQRMHNANSRPMLGFHNWTFSILNHA